MHKYNSTNEISWSFLKFVQWLKLECVVILVRYISSRVFVIKQVGKGLISLGLILPVNI